MTVGLKDLPRSYLPGWGPKRPHSSDVCTEPVPSAPLQPGQEGMQGTSAQHSISVRLGHSAPQSLPFPALPHCLHCPVGLSTTTRAHIPPAPPSQDLLSLIPSALMVIKSDLIGHTVPFLPLPIVTAARRQETTFPKSRS